MGHRRVPICATCPHPGMRDDIPFFSPSVVFKKTTCGDRTCRGDCLETAFEDGMVEQGDELEEAEEDSSSEDGTPPDLSSDE